jgi:tetratricopeptide (TPR) repeat protein
VHLQELIVVRQEVVHLVSSTDPDIGSFLTDLANALSREWEKTGSMERLDQAILVYKDAASRTSPTHRNRARWENNLGNAFAWKYEKTKVITDLSNAVEAYETAVDSISEDDSMRIPYLRSLSSALLKRYERQGSMGDLITGVQTLQDIVYVTAADESTLPATLNNLGNLLQYVYDMTESKDILLQALDANQRAVELSKPEDSNRAIYTSSLGIVFLTLFERDRSPSYLKSAIINQRQALTLLPNEHPDRGRCLHNLGNALIAQFEIDDDLDCLNLAITNLQDAASALLDNATGRPACLISLGIAAKKRYELENSLADINLAVSSIELAINETAPDHPQRASFLNTYGTTLQTQFAESNSNEDYNRVIQAYEDAARSIESPPTIRIIAARNAANLLLFRDIRRASESYKLAVELLPRVSPRTLSRGEQQSALTEFVGLGSTAAALCLEAHGSPLEALQRQEQGRGIMASLISDTRTEITALETSHKELASRFQELRNELDTPMPRYTGTVTSDDEQYQFQLKIRRRGMVSLQFDQVLEEIRGQKDFERFLLPPSEHDMTELAERGPIVVFNICRLRCDVFLVTRDGISSVRLNELHYDDIVARVEVLNEHLLASRLGRISRDARPLFYQERGEEMNILLQWLWRVAAGPVLDELGFKASPDPGNAWPRVWWITTGALTVFPIHAAYRRSNGSSESVLDRVISSYIPTIKALAHARKRATRLAQERIKDVLLVGMPTTPNMNSLPGVKTELDCLQNWLSDSMSLSTLNLPSKAEVISKLPSSQIVHFACHGESDLSDPSESTLFLSDWQVARFRVSDILELNLAKAQFAYLSLCHAANNSQMTLLDEGVHLAGAFHLAGFPSLVATLWQIHDLHSVRFSKVVYEYLLQANGQMDISKACDGVHVAIRQLRDSLDENEQTGDSHNPFVWAPYIYIGP